MATKAAQISSEDVQIQAVPFAGRVSAEMPAGLQDEVAEVYETRSVDFMEGQTSKEVVEEVRSHKSARSLHGFLSTNLAAIRRTYVLHILRTLLLIVILMWASLPAFWGALANSAKMTRNFEAWFIDRDDSRIGHALWQSISGGPSTGLQLGWVPVSAHTAGTDEQIIDSILNNEAWVAVVVSANLTTRLSDARQNGDATWDPTTAITVYYAQARNEVATGTYVLPITIQTLQTVTTAWATGSAQRYFAQITARNTVNDTALHLIAVAPQTIMPAISWTTINLRPYTAPAAQAVTLVGNIFLCIFAFMLTMSNYNARAAIAPYLPFSSYLALRIVVPMVCYIPLSVSYSLVSLAFDLPFGTKYSKAGGFFLFMVYVYLGMASLGLALEAMITILTPIFAPFFLFLLILYNVAPVVLPAELQNPFYSYGQGFPIYNLSQAVRTILFNTQSQLGLNAGVMLLWIALSAGTVCLFTWYMRRRSIRAARRAMKNVEKAEDSPVKKV
ncbi:hypothetical protein C8Q75DRAFT_864980 [Abortiporus biennis]|nr:hypothetical protein C8Q75DRAFT_864980 [Abortiporus biennis]